ncbi:uncharacterized protein LOC114384584 isoform X2 [Glycine soja]|uniref:uncharacterized protein LOC114384584 isoform X2 n=1 Tax=Glycine soja TaxID=3848 RepID=UPI00103DABD0|nr:uncharacterized protein LOC114384584 isoform X2 [Glycine soja]
MGLMSISRFCFYDPGVGSFKSCSVFFGKFPLFLCGLWFCFLFSSFLATFFLLISLQENVPLEEVFQRCDSNGLTTESVEERLVIFGHNKLEEKKESKVLKFLGFMWNPLSWVMEAATIMVIALADGEMTIGPNLIETIKEIWFPRLQHFLQESRLWLIMFISYVFGEDVSFGGVFRCTTGLADQFGDGKTQQLGPKLWEIVGEQQGILKITGIGEHAHIRTFTEHSTKILAEESYSIGLLFSFYLM